jgi:hypothetical protein
VVEFEKARDAIVSLKMSPEDVPSMPSLVGSIVGGMDVASSGEKVIDKLSAFSVEGIVKIQVGDEGARTACGLLKRERYRNAVEEVKHLGGAIWAGSSKLENPGMVRLKKLVEFLETVSEQSFGG